MPTRELCIQVEMTLRPLKRLFGITSCPLFGGADKDSQLSAYRADGGAHILVATPGRLLDYVNAESINISCITYLVLDEADRMLSMGFEEQLNDILAHIRPDRQTLLFSASFPGRLREASRKWVSDEVISIRCSTLEITSSDRHDRKTTAPTPAADEPVTTSSSDQPSSKKHKPDHPPSHTNNTNTEDKTTTTTTNEEGGDNGNDNEAQPSSSSSSSLSNQLSSVAVSSSIIQHVHVCANHKKPRLLLHFIEKIRNDEKLTKSRQSAAMLIFCTKIKTVMFVIDFLNRHEHNIGVAILHGTLPQVQREKVLADFRAVSDYSIILHRSQF